MNSCLPASMAESSWLLKWQLFSLKETSTRAHFGNICRTEDVKIKISLYELLSFAQTKVWMFQNNDLLFKNEGFHVIPCLSLYDSVLNDKYLSNGCDFHSLNLSDHTIWPLWRCQPFLLRVVVQKENRWKRVASFAVPFFFACYAWAPRTIASVRVWLTRTRTRSRVRVFVERARARLFRDLSWQLPSCVLFVFLHSSGFL